jgi:hypothetical protein|tara:strand:- start:863 stop:1234 length:372 start_codon:yes stop_codon:yes gene_type:complete
MDSDKIANDYEYSRQTYYELIEKGKDALDLAIEIAQQSEHPRAIEVLSGMIKNVGDVNDKLMDLNKKNKDINKSDIPMKAEGTTNNNLFIGSTTDLQRMLQDVEKTAKPANNVIDLTPRLKDE